ncbi:MAG: PAS domain-containing sensor histidine kinase [bacterium]|nr:PAS domain-containing sensor histidine kinase [bacterium]
MQSFTLDAPKELPVTVLDTLQAGVLLTRFDGEVVYLNRMGLEILGHRVLPSPGASIGEVFRSIPELEGAPCEPGRSDDSRQIRIRRGDGSEILVGFRLSRFKSSDSGESELLAVLFQDVSEYALLREERDRLLRIATVSRLLPTIAHEIKNPLAGIASLAEVLLKEITDPSQREDLGAILSEIQRLRHVIDGLGVADGHLLDEADRFLLEPELRSVLGFFDFRASHLGAELSLECAKDLAVELNRPLLRMLLVNLLTNALEACGSGDVLHLSALLRPSELELRITDSGQGMCPETLARSTELFYSTKRRGSGIGLSLVDEVVRRSGGELRISSAVGEGTDVFLSVPLKEHP